MKSCFSPGLNDKNVTPHQQVRDCKTGEIMLDKLLRKRYIAACFSVLGCNPSSSIFPECTDRGPVACDPDDEYNEPGCCAKKIAAFDR